MSPLSLPLASKWVCLFSTKGRARYLDVFKLYADGTMDRHAYGSVCLDVPLILLNPEHPDTNRTRPSNFAQACDLFPDAGVYRFLRLIEDDIIERKIWRAVNPIFYMVSEIDDHYSPIAVVGLDYGEALAQLREFGQPSTITLKP